MKNSPEQIGGILLAGGKSSRMGKEKGQLTLGGKKLYEYPLSVLESFCDDIIISVCPGNDYRFNYPGICDEVPGLGPLGGILSCLEVSASEINLIMSYDMPLITKGLIRYLIDQQGDFELVVPGFSRERPEPLCALYNKSMIPVIRQQIEKGEYAVHGLIPLVRSLFVKVEPGMPFYNPELFLNINRAEDLKQFPGNTQNEI